MAIYRVYSTSSDKYIRLNNKFEAPLKTDAYNEVLDTGKTNGKSAKNLKLSAAGNFGFLGSGIAFIPKNKKAKIATGILGAAAGAGLGYASQAAFLKYLAKKKDTETWQRYRDNIKVSEGEMSEEDFDKKWKNKKKK